MAIGDLLYQNPLAHTRRITAIAVASGDTTGTWDMATADDGGMVQVWELKPRSKSEAPANGNVLTAKARLGTVALTDPVGTLTFTTDGKTVATGGPDRLIRLRDPETGQERATLTGHTDAVLLVAFRADDRALLTVGREGAVRLWRAAR
jgi:eukaryotic-like serine/threonine-protein kinase